jgi:tungstate transport system permease protein
MEFLAASLHAALALIAQNDADVAAAVWVSLATAGCSALLAAVTGIPLGLGLALGDFRGKRLATTFCNTLMALPTVVIGLLVYALLSRRGPLGDLELLFTPTAMVVGQYLLALPIMITGTASAVRGADPRILPTLTTLGASPLQRMLQLLGEVRTGLLAALVAAFGRVIAEVGVAMMLGGNIRGYTRTMTTAIALETSKGEFAFGLALGLLLLGVALLVNLLLNLLQDA